ncbi:UBP-type zinc finger domain-containing protein [Chloroflexota bacterium]
MAECGHTDQIKVLTPNAEGCEECLKTGGWWVNLRLCLACGHVGCCDSSPGKHATRHFHDTGHPIVQLGIEGGEDRWCYADSVSVPLS